YLEVGQTVLVLVEVPAPFGRLPLQIGRFIGNHFPFWYREIRILATVLRPTINIQSHVSPSLLGFPLHPEMTGWRFARPLGFLPRPFCTPPSNATGPA